MDGLRPGPVSARGADGAGPPGFTLLEAVVALVVVGVGSGGAVAAVSHGLEIQAEVGRQAEALALAEARLLEVETLPRDSLPSEGVGSSEASVELAGRSYARGTTVRRIGETDLWRVTVASGWEDGRVRLTTVLHRPAPDPFEGRRAR